jgi:hypothetical protein
MSKTGYVLIEFQKENYRADLLSNDDEDADDIMTGLIQKDKTIKYLSPGGIIKDIVVKINNKEGIPLDIIKLHNILTEDLDKKLKDCAASSKDPNIQTECLGHIENLEMLTIGGHKINNIEFTGVVIEVYILTDNPVRDGSKFVLSNSGGKGTVQYVIPKDKTPIATETGLEIEFIGTPLSIIGRKSPNIIYNLYLGKIMYFLNLKCIEYTKNNKFSIMKKLVLDIYEILDKTKDNSIYSEVNEFFNKEPRTIQKLILSSDPLNRPIFPAIVPPFKNHLVMNDLEKAAKLLDIPLNEKVRILENDTVTENEVIVGVLPIYMLEHFPKGMSSVRGSLNIKDQFITGQGISGSAEGKGAIKVGLYDTFGLLSKNHGKGKEHGHLFKELHSIKSDAVISKRKYINSLIYKNELPSIDNLTETDKRDTKTKNFIEAMFIGCGLEPTF